MREFTLDNRCDLKCIYFPVISYEKTSKNYEIDKNGVKHGTVKAYCGFDDHIITNWENCPNYCAEIISKNNPNDKKVIILLGKSASGKDYVLNYLKEKYGFNPIVSHTTRPIRINEVEGKDYYFTKSKEFSKMLSQNKFIESRKYTTCFNDKKDIWYYGIAKEEFDNKTRKICVVDTTGQTEIIKYCGEDNVISIYIDAKDEVREKRAKLRGSFSQSEWDRRLKDDNKKFKNAKYNYLVENNGSVRKLEKNIENILRKENLIG